MQALTSELLIRNAGEELLRNLSPVTGTDAWGTIVAVFDRSFNVRFSNDVLVNFHTERHAIHPLAVWIDDACFRYAQEGVTVLLDWPQVRIGVKTWTIRTGIDEFSTNGWNPEALELNLTGLSGALALNRRRSMVTTPGGYFEMPIRQLGNELKRAADRGPRVNLGKYILFFGGGEGATPAWDDFCTGMLLSDRILARLHETAEKLICVDEDFMGALRCRTTEISFWQIFLADSGYSSLRIECLIKSIFQKPVTVSQMVRCFDIGHSSGADILSGVCHYLKNVFTPVAA